MRLKTSSGRSNSQDGYILTNAYVVENADEVTVRLTDKREFKAKVVGADKRSDIALLKISAKDLPVVSIGDTSKLEVGEWVVDWIAIRLHQLCFSGYRKYHGTQPVRREYHSLYSD